ncbi:MAG: SIS domain-containing protein [Alphaproteobacteria bacterium]|nr:SIS domain-containing protein [Alphaproteobacteria bacterium]
MKQRIANYFNTLHDCASNAFITDGDGKPLTPHEAYDRATGEVRATHNNGNKLMFIGNGGSAGIASHMAIDYSKNGGIRSMAFNDGAALTCLGNDLGYENVFAKQVELHARPGDLLIAISSSGKSVNILKAADVARERGCTVYTFSGFSADNPLRNYGELNFYVDSGEYGFVEISHLALIHSILDLEMGWGIDAGKASEQSEKSARAAA